MKKYFYTIVLSVICISYTFSQNAIIADHNSAKLSIIPTNWIDSAKVNLHIAYGHTSHGSQLITGMEGLKNWKGNQYAFNEGGTNGALDIDDYAFSGASDLGNPNRTAWASATRDYLNNPSNSDVNVVIWSWCGQVSNATENDINTYLNLMTGLENDYPNVKFVYMTGHLDGTGLSGNLNSRNDQIRNYCDLNNKILFDFADIESYDPDGNYFLDKAANDNCDYDSDGNGSRDKNWAEEWQNSHTLNVHWYNCSAAHSKPLNGNLKAYAAWWLWSRLAGWNPATNISDETVLYNYSLSQNYPNPFNPNTTISWQTAAEGGLTIKLFNVLGKEIETIVDGYYQAGNHSILYTTKSALPSGVYYYQLKAGAFTQTRKMILLK
ncbi:MAG: T9SS type A sorting domain-containing protein [Ignavibacterium sp.]|nr:T9SS type A sorting domain-containing protein [Ignavibacterium sp.]